MNESQERVNKQIFWMIVASFLFVTIICFQSFFIGMLKAISLIPSWWLLIIMPSFGFAVIYSINRGEEEIRAAEAEVFGKQQQIIEIERQFRLIKSDLMTLSRFQFTYYCTDLLKVLGYEDVIVKDDLSAITAKNKEQQYVYIACFHHQDYVVIDDALIHQFELAKSQYPEFKGLIMTSVDFTEEALKLAKERQIECYNGLAISKLVWLALATTSTKEKAQSS